MEDYKAALAYLEAEHNEMPLDDQKEFFKKVAEGIKAAASELKEDDKLYSEKLVMLNYAAISYANQAAFIKFRSDKTSINPLFDKVATPESATEARDKVTDARKAEIARINEEHDTIVLEQKELDRFMGRIAGMSNEQIAQQMAAQEEQMNQVRK